MKKRIFGLETEFGLALTSRGQCVLPVSRVVPYLFAQFNIAGDFSNVFLENGARFYLDTGSHPEYATPECASPNDVVIYDKAGERLLETYVQYAQRKIQDEGLHGEVALFKNNTDFVGNTYGCHENYLADRTVDFTVMAERLIPFLVSRQIFTGAGKVYRRRGGTVFHLSQRARYIRKTVAETTANERGIVNTRDEPHASKDNYRRLHIIVGDSNMSEFTTYLKVGTTALVLDMIEDGFIPPDFALRHPVEALKDISRDLTCREPVPLQNGQQYSALELQKAYLELAHRYYSSRPLSTTAADLLRRWEHVLTALAEDPMQLHQEIDWVIKHHLLTAYAARSQRSPEATADRLLMLDLQYHDIRRSKGLYYLLERQGRVARIATEAQIETAMVEPPPDTRAKIRGDLIKFANLRQIPYEIDWDYIRIGYLLHLWIKCQDPFQYESDQVAHLMRRLEDAPMVGG